jgi:flagellar biosynthesis protein
MMADKSIESRRRQLAVALRYDEEKDASPRVIARGKGAVAEKILEIAEKNDIPIREDADLAQSLAQLDLGEMIPGELYPAVAEVLAYVYRINNRQLKADKRS